MVVPFQQWLDADKHIHFDLENGSDFANALRHKHDGTQVLPEQIWPMLKEFFDTEMYRQGAIDGAVEAINKLSDTADVVILTNLMDDRQEARAEQLRAVGIDCPVYCNQGGKGEALSSILAEYQPSVTVFVDDLGHQHGSVAKHAPEVWRLQMVGEPILAKHIKTNPAAHARIDSWSEALVWIGDKLEKRVAAPAMDIPSENLDPANHA
ncbi:HAD family hydrolase [Parasphingorhabdus halotolerans]|uniref:HAD family hydrolase n=1 Tax=Parasphingorhabdus halotolerans TaxID=2725558 RepID=A0A6H2DRF8_9SPHN|nr:HAD family hydrolase [Parasphingorhabdus halotolerans]QJB70798.1 HAD family hydrolase [Parasphingorhabdus halotolerans]